MDKTSRNKSKWTLEICRHEALKYSNRAEFQKKSPAYKAAYKFGWLDAICGHMTKPKPHNHKWTFETCQIEAKKYSFKKDFHKNANGAFQIASRNKWLEEICSHMTEIKKPHRHWTKQKCAEEALKYMHRKEFANGSSGAYSSAQKNNWIDEICLHMTPLGNELLRHVYAFLFSDGSIYFGLTDNINRRTADHKSDPTSKVFKHIRLTNEQPIFKLITPYFIPTELAQLIEKTLIKVYTEKGFKVLNSDKGGGIGGTKLKWTNEKLRIEAKKYKTRGEFQINSASAYSSAHKRGLLNQICGHMYEPKKPHGFWTKARCIEEAKKYKSKQDFRTHSSAAYGKAEKNKWLNEICQHMKEIKKPNGFWNLEMCLNEAKKYSSYIEFQSNSSSAYGAALKNGWLKLIQVNYKNIKRPNGYWTFELCKAEAKKYKNKRQFSIGSSGAYDSAYKNKWLDVFFPQKQNAST